MTISDLFVYCSCLTTAPHFKNLTECGSVSRHPLSQVNSVPSAGVPCPAVKHTSVIPHAPQENGKQVSMHEYGMQQRLLIIPRLLCGSAYHDFCV